MKNYGHRLVWSKRLTAWTDWRTLILAVAVSNRRYLRIEMRWR